MSTNIDDPLADLLSDNSLDNENFFEPVTQVGAARRPQASVRSSVPASKSAKKIEELFGIKEEISSSTAANQASTSPWDSTNDAAPKATSTPRKQTDGRAAKPEDDDDLGFDPKKPKGSAKRDILDDLLAPITGGDKKASTTLLKAPISRQSTDTTTDNSHAFARPKTSSGRRSSGTSALANSSDPLGLLFGGGGASAGSKPNLASSSGVSTPLQKKRTPAGGGGSLSAATADWLGLGLDVPEDGPDGGNSEAAPQHSGDNRAASPAPTTGSKYEAMPQKLPETVATVPVIAGPQVDIDSSSTAQNILMLNNMAVEANNSLAMLQQQEANLLMATQMSTHEKALLEIKQRQDAMMKHQEMQFQSLMQQQMQRQRKMEEHIKQQQQRINAHLQLFLVPPVAAITSGPAGDEAGGGDASSRTLVNESAAASEHGANVAGGGVDVIELESNVKRLELERSRLEELLESLRISCDQEVDTVKGSYKKQLAVMEEHLALVEGRLREDLEEQRQYFLKKVQLLESDLAKSKAEYETTIGNLKQEHEDDVRKLRKSHEEDLDTLKEEHRRMLENVRQAKFLEFAMVQENGSYLQTLRSASSNLEHISGGLQELRDEMHTKIDTLEMEREAKLEERERRVADAERRLKIGEEKSESERGRLMALVTSIELQMSSMSKERGEEQWVVRQKMAALEAERLAFEKEKEFAREQMARDEKRLADLKEAQLAEQQRLAAELHEQQAKLAVERSKLETKMRLNPDPNGEQQKLELEAAIEVARDATKQAIAERERFRQLQRQLEHTRRQIIDEESALAAKHEDLDMEIRSYQMARQKAQAELLQAKAEEQNFQAKSLFLAERTRELNNREAEVSQERLLITKERVELQEAKRSLLKRCVLCHMNSQNEQITRHLDQQRQIRLGEQQSSSIDLGALRLDSSNPMANFANVIPTASLKPDADDDPGGVLQRDRSRELCMASFPQSNDIVDRMLDESIDESFRRMRSSTGTLE